MSIFYMNVNILQVDFAPPVGYVEPTTSRNAKSERLEDMTSSNYAAVQDNTIGVFGGSGNRLDGFFFKTSSAFVA